MGTVRPGLPAAVAALEAWLRTMRQPGGYGGPVAHWWQNRYRYAGPGLDWRYEGVLVGYAALADKAGDPAFARSLGEAADDLIAGQTEEGHFPASRFEINPGVLGTPHEAAASLGLLLATPRLARRDAALGAARRNLDALVRALWDERGRGFNDGVGARGRVPNKLATLAHALLACARESGEARYLDLARHALDDVVRFTVPGGPFAGAVHQYAPGAERGDGRFFPYYNARCIPPLVAGAEALDEPRYLEVARAVLGFVERSRLPDGSWPQIVYEGGGRADWPRWVAGVADILLAYRALGEPLPEAALDRLLGAQLPSGAFPTARGFASQISQRPPGPLPHYRDVTPVVGWNDKVFRLLSECVRAGPLPTPSRGEVSVDVVVAGRRARFTETDRSIVVTGRRRRFYEWHKHEVWARIVHPSVDTH